MKKIKSCIRSVDLAQERGENVTAKDLKFRDFTDGNEPMFSREQLLLIAASVEEIRHGRDYFVFCYDAIKYEDEGPIRRALENEIRRRLKKQAYGGQLEGGPKEKVLALAAKTAKRP